MNDTSQPDQQFLGLPSTAFAQQASVCHECSHACCVERQFGNVYRCHTSGQVHVCDNNCQQQVYNDRYSRICRVSKRVFWLPASCVEPVPSR
jgi:hypothetical protein